MSKGQNVILNTIKLKQNQNSMPVTVSFDEKLEKVHILKYPTYVF